MTETYDIDAMVKQLIPEEGERYFVYDDANGMAIRAGSHVAGSPTVGIGRNLASRGMTGAEITNACQNDIIDFAATLDRETPWWRSLSPLRQRQMLDLCFNMGWGSLSQFHLFLAAMQAGNWNEAVAQLKASHWWHQVGERAPEIAARITAG